MLIHRDVPKVSTNDCLPNEVLKEKSRNDKT